MHILKSKSTRNPLKSNGLVTQAAMLSFTTLMLGVPSSAALTWLCASLRYKIAEMQPGQAQIMAHKFEQIMQVIFY